MELLCARLRCRLEAAASLQFNTDDAQVIIIDLTDPTGGIPLCADHVKTRTAPVGWTMVDQRLGLPPRRHLESVPQPQLSMSISAPTRPGPEDTSNHPAANDVSDRVSSDIVAPSVSGPTERPSLRRPVDRGFPWEWARTEPAAEADDDDPAGDESDGPQAAVEAPVIELDHGHDVTANDLAAREIDAESLDAHDSDAHDTDDNDAETDDSTVADVDERSEGMGPSGVDTTSKPSTPLLSRAFRNNPIDPDEAS